MAKIRLTEGQLKKIIREAVENAVKQTKFLTEQDTTYRFYNRDKYKHVENLTVGDKHLHSSYNHNYYVNENTGDIILEICDDDSFFDYYRINQDGTKKYLGGLPCVSGIFGDGDFLESDAPVENDGAVVLDTNW